jgi:hypothetical protein
MGLLLYCDEHLRLGLDLCMTLHLNPENPLMYRLAR